MRRVAPLSFISIAVAVLMLCGRFVVYAQPSAINSPSASASPAGSEATLKPGTIIGADNASQYERYIPAAGKFALSHGFRMRITPERRIEWSAGFRHATEISPTRRPR